MSNSPRQSLGFTLVELSIVLVIIGLIIGGVLVGRDLIAAAGIRAQISQIEKINTAVNTFRGKYGYLPGDIPDPTATQYGFASRAGSQGRGDGNGLIEGYDYYNGAATTNKQSGEPFLFFADLSKAGLIKGGFTAATDGTSGWPAYPGPLTNSTVSLFLPKLDSGNAGYISIITMENSFNYYSLSAIGSLTASGTEYNTDGALSVSMAYAMDNKFDDGLPQSGKVQALYFGGGGGFVRAPWLGIGQVVADAGWAPNAPSASSTTCFDTTTGNYSIGVNNGNGMNCGISIKF